MSRFDRTILVLTTIHLPSPLRLFGGAATLWLLLPLLITGAGEPTGRAGDRYAELQCGNQRYHDVEVRQVTADSLTVRHREGLAKLPLAGLPPATQKLYGFDPNAPRLATAPAQPPPRTAPVPPAPRPATSLTSVQKSSPATASTLIDRLLLSFGKEPEIRRAVDLRPQFVELELSAKNQGRRPSCAVFAVVSALEFQNAAVTGHPESLSEEYLIWATRKLSGLPTGQLRAADRDQSGLSMEEVPTDSDEDAGFDFLTVVQALRAYGILTRDRMPNTFGKGMAEIPDPSPQLIEEARHRRTVTTLTIPGRQNGVQIKNIIHVLNAGLPVVVGLAWPPNRTLWHTGFLQDQTPRQGTGHAVTLVGYTTDTGRLENTVFIFKNSYGRRWGTGGYGFAAYNYLEKHLQGAVFLDVGVPQPGRP